MNIQFRKLYLPQLPEVDADALIELAGDKQDSGLNLPALPNGVTKSKTISRSNLDKIIWDLENGNAQNVTLLEWVHCLYNKEKWDALNSARSKSTSELIWVAAQQNSWLKQKLFWLLIFYYDGRKALASSLAKSYYIFLPQDSQDKKIMSVIESFNENFAEIKLTQLCLDSLLTPRELFLQHKLPSKISIVEKCLFNVVSLFSKTTKKNKEKANWLLKCFEQMKSTQQIKAVEELLTTANPILGAEYPELINWLRRYYGSSVSDSRWNELSSQAKTAMRKWLGAVSYQDFQRLVSLILDRVPLAEHEHRRLKSRSGFWSNYSDRFERIRILLPQSSVDILGNYLNNQDISILLEDGSNPTEICIFDFGNWFLVEFFRGNGSETRIFEKNAETEQQLFNSQLSIKRLRCLGLNKSIHDHEYIWQYFCEQWLRQKSILPNTGIENFKGLPYRYSKYNWQTGLPKPSFENQRRRDRKLEYWRQDIAKLEREAKEYFKHKKDFCNINPDHLKVMYEQLEKNLD